MIDWESIENEKVLKARHGDYVIYQVDYLLSNLAREVCIMEEARKMSQKEKK